jgi:hypothetical protein
MREESAKYIARAEAAMRREMEGPSSIDRAVDHYVKVAKTQAAIGKELKQMAEVLAAAAIASEKALGDRATYALDKWLAVLRTETIRLIGEKRQEKPALEDGKTIDVKANE